MKNLIDFRNKTSFFINQHECAKMEVLYIDENLSTKELQDKEHKKFPIITMKFSFF